MRSRTRQRLQGHKLSTGHAVPIRLFARVFHAIGGDSPPICRLRVPRGGHEARFGGRSVGDPFRREREGFMSDQQEEILAPRPLCKGRDIEGRLRRYMPVVLRAARHHWEMLGRRVDYGELVTAGAMALLRAAEIHDEERAPFPIHLRRRLKWAMKEVARQRLGRQLDVSSGMPDCVARRYGDGNRRVGGAIELDDARVSSVFEGRQTWLGTVAPTEIIDDIAMSDDDDPEGTLIRKDLLEHIVRALGDLDHAQRTLLERHYFDGERFAVVAGELGISPFAACRLHRRALVALQRTLKPVFSDEPVRAAG
jgi:RNA polymerase sigma factor FliA